jgi:hypothetical protein
MKERPSEKAEMKKAIGLDSWCEKKARENIFYQTNWVTY